MRGKNGKTTAWISKKRMRWLHGSNRDSGMGEILLLRAGVSLK